LSHNGQTFLPVKARVEVKHILGRRDLGVMKDKNGYYSGDVEWHLNPTTIIFGNFSVSEECRESSEDLRIEVRLTIIDQHDREHRYLTQCWKYDREGNYWFLEPRSFTRWT